MDFTTIWGTLLIIAGAVILLNSLFGIALPLFKILIGGLLIYAGISLIADLSQGPLTQSIFFQSKKINARHASSQAYNSVFAHTTIDLSDPTLISDQEITITGVCSSLQVLVPTTTNFSIKAAAALSNITLPDGQVVRGFGSASSSKSCNNTPTLKLKVNGALSSLSIEEKVT